MNRPYPSGQTNTSGESQWGRLDRLRTFFERWGASHASMFSLGILAVLGYAQAIPNPVLAAGVLFVALSEFIRRLDTGIPLLQITTLIASLQWLVGPAISYTTAMTTGRYFMYVDERAYFSFAVPATAFFAIGMFFMGSSVRQKLVLQSLNRSEFVRIGLLLNLVAIVATFMAPRMPGGLQFFFHLVSQLKYIGAIYFLLSGHPYRYVLGIFSCLQLFTTGAAAGMFHDLIIWILLISTYWFAQFRLTLGRKLAFLGVAFVAIFLIQAIKQDYRDKLRRGVATSIPEEVWGVLTADRAVFEGQILPLATARLNQGWIISAVMRNVPAREPYAEGETIVEAMRATLLPRFLAPDKKKAGGREYFRRFTGLPIGEGTSMGISPLGEAYANFGRELGILFMFGYGLGFAAIYQLVLRKVVLHPDFLFWIPLIFYQGIKAETEIVVVMNQLFKGTIIAYGGYYGLTQVLYPQVFGRVYRVLRSNPAANEAGPIGGSVRV
jgi:hypothetical protein